MNASDERGTVLLVDDDHGVRTVTAMILRRQGFTVLTAGDGRAGVDELRAHPEVDVVLLDVMMPVMTGHEALPRLRELQPDLPVVFFSGFDPNEVAEHLAADGPHTTFVPKPYRDDALVTALDEAIASRATT